MATLLTGSKWDHCIAETFAIPPTPEAGLHIILALLPIERGPNTGYLDLDVAV